MKTKVIHSVSSRQFISDFHINYNTESALKLLEYIKTNCIMLLTYMLYNAFVIRRLT